MLGTVSLVAGLSSGRRTLDAEPPAGLAAREVATEGGAVPDCPRALLSALTRRNGGLKINSGGTCTHVKSYELFSFDNEGNSVP